MILATVVRCPDLIRGGANPWIGTVDELLRYRIDHLEAVETRLRDAGILPFLDENSTSMDASIFDVEAVDALTLDDLRNIADDPNLTIVDDLLDTAGAAAMVGVTRKTVTSYAWRGLLPPPDVMLGRSPGWTSTTILAWLRARPGRGAGGGRPSL